MKAFRLWCFLIFGLWPKIIFAEFIKVIPPEQRYQKSQKKAPQPPPIKKSRRSDNGVYNRLQQSNLQINDLLSKLADQVEVYDGTVQFDFPTGTVIKGILLNSVVSTNLESPLLVQVKGQQLLPEGTKFSCEGVTKHRRVVSACNLMITENGEFEVQAILLNRDGTAGLRGEIYDPREVYMASTVATGFSKGMIAGAQDRLPTLMGEMTPNTLKNRTLQGLLESATEATDILKGEVKEMEPVVSIDAGQEVLIYFKKSLKI